MSLVSWFCFLGVFEVGLTRIVTKITVQPEINIIQEKAVIGVVRENVGLKWPKGDIAYLFDDKTYDEVVLKRVHEAMETLEGVTCIKFKPLTEKPKNNATAFIHISNPFNERACVHSTRSRDNTGEVLLVLGIDCLKRRDVLHSLLHAVGMKDEVTHPLRDQYIRVMWNNIIPAFYDLFKIQGNPREVIGEYDPRSIMHFSDRAFSVNGHATITSVMPGLMINPSDDLSLLDKMKLRILFGHECSVRKANSILDKCKNILRQNAPNEDYDENEEAEVPGTNNNQDNNNNNRMPHRPPPDGEARPPAAVPAGKLEVVPILPIIDVDSNDNNVKPYGPMPDDGEYKPPMAIPGAKLEGYPIPPRADDAQDRKNEDVQDQQTLKFSKPNNNEGMIEDETKNVQTNAENNYPDEDGLQKGETE